MAVSTAFLSTKNLIKILTSKYQIIPSQTDLVQISEFSEGYMNHVYKVEFGGCDLVSNEIKQFIVILYNSQRYRGQSGFSFLSTMSAITDYLNQKGYPARQAIKNNNRDYLTEIELDSSAKQTNLRLLGVYQYLPGNTLEWDAYTRRHLRSAGQHLAVLHRLLVDYTGDISAIKSWSDYLEADSQRMLAYLHKNAVHLQRKLKIVIDFPKLEQLITSLQKLSTANQSQQLIHCDFVRGNILFSSKKLTNIYEITGVLDFEKLLVGPIEVDLARTVAFLWIDCRYKTPVEIDQYFLQEGYSLLGKGKKIAISQIDQYMVYFWLRDLWKFLESNPYQDLPQNFHFQKTVEILEKRQLLTIT